MAEEFRIEQFPNGLTLLGQRMEHVSSAAMTLAISAGSAHDPPTSAGAASIISQWCLKGAGGRDNRQLNDALDALGSRHGEEVHSEHLVFSSTQLGQNLADVLAIYADILRRPRLDDECFEPCRQLTRQDLASLEDEPARKANMLLREKFFPYPLGRNRYGTDQTLAHMQPGVAREHVRRGLGPSRTILAVAGAFDWPVLLAQVRDLLGDWTGQDAPPLPIQPLKPCVTHLAKDSAQAHIVMAHPTVTMSHEQYYPARMAVAVLSGGMSSRLFTEVREKRGLVYHVSAHYQSLRDYAGVFTYAGTTPAKAQETFEATLAEIRRLGEGISPDEMDRSRVQLKSALVMQGESTGARASALASDWYHLHRLRSLEEISAAIDAVRGEQVIDHLRQYPPKGLSVLVIGPQPLNTAPLS